MDRCNIVVSVNLLLFCQIFNKKFQYKVSPKEFAGRVVISRLKPAPRKCLYLRSIRIFIIYLGWSKKENVFCFNISMNHPVVVLENILYRAVFNVTRLYGIYSYIHGLLQHGCTVKSVSFQKPGWHLTSQGELYSTYTDYSRQNGTVQQINQLGRAVKYLYRLFQAKRDSAAN